MRYPTTKTASAQSQNNLVAQQLDNSAPSFRRRLYNLFTNYHSYEYFSNEAWFSSSNNPNGYDSIESLHDQIHGLAGSGGHLSVGAQIPNYPRKVWGRELADRLPPYPVH
jgi:tyrosinase